MEHHAKSTIVAHSTIENSIFYGANELSTILRVILVKSNNPELNQQILAAYSQLSPVLLNKLYAADYIKTPVKRFLAPYAGRVMTDTAKSAGDLLEFAVKYVNSDISAAKRIDTKQNRELEKQEILFLFKENAYQFKLLFDIRNILIQNQNLFQT